MQGARLSAQWKIHVTKKRFIFDSSRGSRAADGGKGTLENPFKTIADFCPDDEKNGLRQSRYTDYLVYFREGTYRLDGFKAGWGGVKTKEWMNFRNQHPNILMGYPGENVVFDMESKYSLNVCGQPDFCIDSISFRGLKNHNPIHQINAPASHRSSA